MNFSSTVKDIFTIKTLRRKVMYTLFFAIIYRLGTYIYLPYLQPLLLIKEKRADSFIDNLIGSAWSTHSVFALGIQSYITASILTQLASFAVPYFQRLEKEGRSGRSKLDMITRWLTIPIGIAHSLINLLGRVREKGFIAVVYGGEKNLLRFYILAVFVMVAGALFAIWLADQITHKGLGSGSSVLIMVNILSGLPQAIMDDVKKQLSEQKQVLFFIIEFIVLFVIILAVVMYMQGVRKITLQYARQIMSGYGYAGGSKHQHLPIKMNATGVMPIMFSGIFMQILSVLVDFLKNRVFKNATMDGLSEVLRSEFHWKFKALQAFLIFFGTLVYASVFIDPYKIANELKRNNAFISGIQPGKPTGDYISTIQSRVIFVGALFLVAIVIIPVFAYRAGVEKSLARFYGGSNLLIIVSVMINMFEQIKGHLNMHYYDKMMRDAEKMPEI